MNYSEAILDAGTTERPVHQIPWRCLICVKHSQITIANISFNIEWDWQLMFLIAVSEKNVAQCINENKLPLWE